jgi:hypothetical protein
MKLQIATTVAVLALAGAAFAQQPPPGGGGQGGSPEMQAARQQMREACAADMKSTCGDKEGREAMMCLMQNQDKVSQGCKDAMAKMRAARQAGGGGH